MAETFEKMTERNKRVQTRYDELMHEGKHGHYETIFRVVREECQQAVEVRERELLRKLEALQMRLAPIEEARQQARDAALEQVLDILAKHGDDESETYHQIYMLKSDALKSTASGDSEVQNVIDLKECIDIEARAVRRGYDMAIEMLRRTAKSTGYSTENKSDPWLDCADWLDANRPGEAR